MSDLEKRLREAYRDSIGDELTGAAFDVFDLCLEAADTLAAVREWAERASAGYDADNYNITATPQEACGKAILAALAAAAERFEPPAMGRHPDDVPSFVVRSDT